MPTPTTDLFQLNSDRLGKCVQLILGSITLARGGNACHSVEFQTHLVGHELSEPAESEIIAVSPFDNVLRGVETSHGETTCFGGSKGHLLKAREPTSWLMCMVFAWIK